ncbi:MAG: DUF1697 domain-containing protein, partial [Nocardioides sp.]|nr:DUF1697 domain-containing protein [Nocardioides sp.]
RLTTAMRSRARIEDKLEQVFRDNRGFEVPTVVFSIAELARIGADAEELNHPGLARHYLWLVKDELSPEAIEAAHALGKDGHRVVVRGRACHLLLQPVEAGVVDPLRVEKLLGVATNRNFNVVTTLAKKWC